MPGQGWVAAGELSEGSQIISQAGPKLTVSSVQWQRVAPARLGQVVPGPLGYTVYNFEVASTHSYFVGTANGGTWVHNACNPNNLVKDILKGKKGSITKAPLDEGAPTWDDILNKTFGEIDKKAGQNLPGYKTIRKLLTDKRFNK